jgi:hypothetical protein
MPVLQVAVLVVALLASPAARASLSIEEWYVGHWDCEIDRRRGEMLWRRERWQRDPVGYFLDNGTRWVELSRVHSNDRQLVMRHADGNEWMLRLVGGGRNVAEGFTTWSGRRFRLVCEERR